ncbi:hypothetical protein BURCENBC7_AP6958 [Burkholderia cenocepacia BC7]|nr:hypothetical protein BURCENK562V_C1360 [Burkholderia cenocepacia K56-2Valvano]ERI28787.1 hypothetical protein BURCENBC7_AP6958 [Burkholderia cenocepacia BC7]
MATTARHDPLACGPARSAIEPVARAPTEMPARACPLNA